MRGGVLLIVAPCESWDGPRLLGSRQHSIEAIYATRRVTNALCGIVVMLWRVANAASKP